MRFSVITFSILVWLLQGCSSINIYPTKAANTGTEGALLPSPQSATKVQPVYRLDKELRSIATSPTNPAPDVIINLNPVSDVFPGDVNVRLQAVAEKLKSDERLSIRLEGYAPDGGSPAWNIGAAEKSVRLVKKRLEAMRVPPRRIQIASYGEEHEVERDKSWHWVEIYYIRPRK